MEVMRCTLKTSCWTEGEIPSSPTGAFGEAPGVKSTEIAWNRKMRRSIEKADHVVLNLFCGPEPSRWSKRVPTGWVIVNVDILQNQDLLNDSPLWHT